MYTKAFIHYGGYYSSPFVQWQGSISKGNITDNILTRMDELESKQEGLNRELLEAAAELGLLGTEIPEEYDGMAMDKISSAIIAECMGWAGSFAQTQGGQVGIGSLPIVFFGSPEQKKKYLPAIATAERGFFSQNIDN